MIAQQAHESTRTVPPPAVCPARVVALGGDGRVEVETDDFVAWARMATVPRYEPAIDDVVLIAGNSRQCFVIGLLAGRGRIVIDAPGGVAIESSGGTIDLLAAESISVKSQEVVVCGQRVELQAGHLHQCATTLTQSISGAVQQRFGRLVCQIKEALHLKARRITQRADDDVKVNGRTIQLN